jgi:hypothetical protein
MDTRDANRPLQKTLGHRSLDKTMLSARIADPVVEYYRVPRRTRSKGRGPWRKPDGRVRLLAASSVDQLLSTPLPPEEREALLRQMQLCSNHQQRKTIRTSRLRGRNKNYPDASSTHRRNLNVNSLLQSLTRAIRNESGLRKTGLQVDKCGPAGLSDVRDPPGPLTSITSAGERLRDQLGELLPGLR